MKHVKFLIYSIFYLLQDGCRSCGFGVSFQGLGVQGFGAESLGPPLENPKYPALESLGPGTLGAREGVLAGLSGPHSFWGCWLFEGV